MNGLLKQTSEHHCSSKIAKLKDGVTSTTCNFDKTIDDHDDDDTDSDD